VSGLLEVRGIEAGYGAVQVLRGVDLDVPAGKVVALLGPNGAGKSTLLKTIAGLIAPTSGTVTLEGEELTGRPTNDISRAGVCLIPEGRGIFPNLTVADNLRLSLMGHDGAEAQVFDHFPILADRRTQRAGTLSGGEQQMLALARAVATQPRVLMADELSLGLAPLIVQRLFDVTLRRVHDEQGQTILLVEQYATHALRIADVVYILNRGEVAWSGTPDELRGSDELAEAYLGASI